MALGFLDLGRDTFLTEGTGTVTLDDSPPSAYVLPPAGVSPTELAEGIETDYLMWTADRATWEAGRGTRGAANTLSRDTVYQSSAADATVTFPAGTKHIHVGPSAIWFNKIEAMAAAATLSSNLITTLGPITGPLTVVNAADSTPLEVLRLKGLRGTPAAGDQINLTGYLANDLGNEDQFAEIGFGALITTNTAKNGRIVMSIMVDNTKTQVLRTDSIGASVFWPSLYIGDNDATYGGMCVQRVTSNNFFAANANWIGGTGWTRIKESLGAYVITHNQNTDLLKFRLVGASTGVITWSDIFSLLPDAAVFNGTAAIASSLVSIDGSSDKIQLLIQGHSTQTSDILVVEKSDGTDLFTITESLTKSIQPIEIESVTNPRLTLDAGAAGVGVDAVIQISDSAQASRGLLFYDRGNNDWEFWNSPSGNLAATAHFRVGRGGATLAVGNFDFGAGIDNVIVTNAVTIDFTKANIQTLTLAAATGDVTVTITPPTGNSKCQLILTQDDPARDITWAASTGMGRWLQVERTWNSDPVSSIYVIEITSDGTDVMLQTSGPHTASF